MKGASVWLAALSMLIALEASAHLPSPLQPGGGVPTQNVIAGPIKRRPANNIAMNGPTFVWPDAELRNLQPSGSPAPMLHVTAVFLGTEWLDPFFAQDKIAGLDQFFRQYPGSRYAAATDEYMVAGAGNAFVGSEFEETVIDGQLTIGPVTGSVVASRMCDLVDQGRLQLRDDGTTYVAVFS